jgi:hypothetical protein
MMKMAMTEARRVPDRCKMRRRVGASLTPRKAMRGAGNVLHGVIARKSGEKCAKTHISCG